MVFVANVHNTDTFNDMSKGLKGSKDYIMFPTIPSNVMYIKAY